MRSGGLPVLQFPHSRPNHGDHSTQLVVALLCPEDRRPGSSLPAANGAISTSAASVLLFGSDEGPDFVALNPFARQVNKLLLHIF